MGDDVKYNRLVAKGAKRELELRGKKVCHNIQGGTWPIHTGWKFNGFGPTDPQHITYTDDCAKCEGYGWADKHTPLIPFYKPCPSQPEQCVHRSCFVNRCKSCDGTGKGTVS